MSIVRYWTLDAMVWRGGRFVAIINGMPYDRAKDWAISR